MTGADMTATALVTHHPHVDEQRVKVNAPVVSATLLEDRAQVVREGTISLTPGRHRLSVWDTAPTMQDVSLRVTAKGGRVDDARVRRAARVQLHELPEVAHKLEQQLEELATTHRELRDDSERVQQRASTVADMMDKAINELPDDAAWSQGDATTWRQTFETLSQKSRALLTQAHATRRQLVTLQEKAGFIATERQRLDTPDTRVLAIVEIDVTVESAADVVLTLEYIVPNALWRPTHEATLLSDGDGNATLTMRSRAAVWQHTGEDWNDVMLSFSTARSALAHEPPMLRDDEVATQKRDQRVVVQAREVAVSKAGLGRGGGGGAPAAPAAVDLPGVDDGGDIQNLKAQHKMTVPQTGKPVFVPLSEWSSPAQTSLIVMAEADDKAILKASATHKGTSPLLAGPVELVRDSGPVGTTSTLFIAAGEALALGFGPDDDVRVRRTVESHEHIDEVDQWRRRTLTVNLYLSNLGAHDKTIDIVERLPVSEIDHVKITLVADKTSGTPKLDADGFCRWTMNLGARGRLRLTLVYVIAFAPGVQAA